MLGWEPPKDAPTWTVFYGSVALWSTMSFLGIACLLFSRLVIEIDPEGLTRTLGGQIKRVLWADVVAMISSGSDGSSWAIHCSDGRVTKVDVTFIGDRQLLKTSFRHIAQPCPRLRTESSIRKGGTRREALSPAYLS